MTYKSDGYNIPTILKGNCGRWLSGDTVCEVPTPGCKSHEGPHEERNPYTGQWIGYVVESGDNLVRPKHARRN